MSAATTGVKRRWLISAVAAAMVTGALLLLFRAPHVDQPLSRASRTANAPIVVTARPSDEIAIRDLAPLFLPTPYNAAPTIAQPPQPGSAYFDQDPGTHTFFDPDTPALTLPSPVHPPANAVEFLAHTPPPGPTGIGRTNLAVAARPPNGGHVDIFAMDDRDSLLGLTLPVDATPKLPGREAVAWKPLEFVAAVDASGLVGPLMLTSGSGVEEVDDHFRNYLARVFRVGDRLPPGFYRIVVGP